MSTLKVALLQPRPPPAVVGSLASLFAPGLVLAGPTGGDGDRGPGRDHQSQQVTTQTPVLRCPTHQLAAVNVGGNEYVVLTSERFRRRPDRAHRGMSSEILGHLTPTAACSCHPQGILWQGARITWIVWSPRRHIGDNDFKDGRYVSPMALMRLPGKITNAGRIVGPTAASWCCRATRSYAGLISANLAT